MIEDFKNEKGLWAKSGLGQSTRSYKAWYRMYNRCKIGGQYQETRKTYIGCSVTGDFIDFQKFTNWHISQVGYALDGYEIDKDILYQGNREYNEKTCVLIPHQLNKFLTLTNARRGKYPLGVSCFKNKDMYQARISIDSVQKCLGIFNTPEMAHKVYVEAKENEARRWAERLNIGEFLVDKRVIEAMRNWTLNEKEQPH